MLRKTYVESGPLHTSASGLTFSLYSANEVRQMSVVKILTPLSFNSLGHPLPNGLYDLKMGPVDNRNMCLTCQQGQMHCPGHFGHIELPLPVINPLFTKTLLQIFRLSCLVCHTVTLPGLIKYLCVTQLRLLRRGMVKEAVEAEQVLTEAMAVEQEKGKKLKAKRGDSEEARTKFLSYITNALKDRLEDVEIDYEASTQNGESLRQAVTKRVLSYAKMNVKCEACGTVCKKMMLYESKLVYTLTRSLRPRSTKKPRPSKRNPLDVDLDQHEEEEDTQEALDPEAIQKYLTPLEARDHLRKTWEKEEEFFSHLFPVLATTSTEFPTDLFFVEVVSVPPPKNRPSQIVNNIQVEHPQNLALRHVVSSAAMMIYALRAIKKGVETLPPDILKALNGVMGKSLNDKLEVIWKELQLDVDHLLDRDRGTGMQNIASQMIGLKQVIEKKEGLLRMNMMGKRVNFAARTVITPDPMIHIEEIGVPDVFAKVLTFPTQVTPWNVAHLRKLVLNGPLVHPGAVSVENELGQVSRLSATDRAQREGVAARLLVSDASGFGSFKGVKTVNRHLQNGDLLLLNRQPSLHRPSIMGHRTRVLYGDKVLRLHYANCKHYNADFDGDEMNAHFPQSHVARSEAANLVNVCSHYLVPKDGTPLGGLIQDHIVGAVKMTIRGRFFTQADYEQLVFFALSNYSQRIVTEPPTILKPVMLWSGKQVVTTIIRNLVPTGRKAPTFTSTAKIKSDEWRQMEARPFHVSGDWGPDTMSESQVIFRHGQLLTGILDKVHLGATPYGLCHTFYELYGNEAVGGLLSAFSRLMTNFLQWEGFTLGVKDVLVLPPADVLRRAHMIEASKMGPEAAATGVGLPADTESNLLREKLENVHRSRDVKARAIVDQAYKQTLNQVTNQINKSCLPHGLVSIFPHNNLQLLVQSGAKGSTVNTMQMSCLLGQIELEGKRPALTISGKSLPSFKAYDPSPRAGGFIAGRFLTGIRPQEFFFHCMAGREGLIDTAVKTSRSGYLQRCLVKLLEGVVTQYDGTVRDSDGSVIQFLYGEDGLDVCKSQYLKPKLMEFLKDNADCVLDPKLMKTIKALGQEEDVETYKAKMVEWQALNGSRMSKHRQSPSLKFFEHVGPNIPDDGELDVATGRSRKTIELIKKWQNLSQKKRNKYNKMMSRCPEPLISRVRPDSTFGVVSETLEDIVAKASLGLGRKAKKGLQDIVYYKAMRALCTAGDAVGVLAAQSIGEPSTQMTLNTFHFAGRGEMNVTLGIPRLREILMVASATIKTPAMEIPFLSTVTAREAERLRVRLTRVTLAQVLQNVEVREQMDPDSASRLFRLKFTFLKSSEYKKCFSVTPREILKYFEQRFLRYRFFPALRRMAKMKRAPALVEGKKGLFGREVEQEEPESTRPDLFGEAERKGMGDEHQSSDEEPEAEDADATEKTRRSRHTEAEYEEPEEEERLVEPEVEEEGEGEEKIAVDEEEDAGDDVVHIPESQMSVSMEGHNFRVATVRACEEYIDDYEFDRLNEEYCTVTIKMPLTSEKVNLGSVLRTEAAKGVIYEVPNISRAFVAEGPQGKGLVLKTEGINILAMSQFRSLLDLNRVYCNNIHVMAEHYGIESASKVIVKEMTDVFKAYGITLDIRHLTLIADFMTFSGVYRPFNRHGIQSSASPLHQMSFETVISFLQDATLSGRRDELSNPSARLVVGKPAAAGTGIFGLHQKI